MFVFSACAFANAAAAVVYIIFDGAVHVCSDAWDFPMDYAAQTPRYMALVGAEASVEGPTAVMTQQYRLGDEGSDTTLTQTIVLVAGSRRIDFRTTAHWREPQSMLRTSFPVSVRAEMATYEIQFGAIERPTHTNTTCEAQPAVAR